MIDERIALIARRDHQRQLGLLFQIIPIEIPVAIALIAPDLTTRLFGLREGMMRPVAGVTADDDVLSWSRDGRSLFVQQRTAIPGRIERVDPISGARTSVKEIGQLDRGGLLRINVASVINDGRAYAYVYWRRVSRLFVVRGMRL